MYFLSVNAVKAAEGQGNSTAREKRERTEGKPDPKADQLGHRRGELPR